MNKNIVKEIFERLKKSIPNPETELEYENGFTLLVAVILSAQATDVGVNKATKALFKKVKTPEEMLKLGEEGLKEHIKTIGLFNSKAKNVIGMSKALVERFNSKVPDNLEDLMSLDGVGRKTANVILNTLFNHPTIAVDTHVFRVGNRIGLANSADILETERQLVKITPKEYIHEAHHLLILHGRYVCKARKPECGACVIRDLCEFKGKLG